MERCIAASAVIAFEDVYGGLLEVVDAEALWVWV